MPSSFTWLDYSEFERQRMLNVIELFGDRSTVDELGLGTVRDVFADKLFPGTSTIQTRAKYFLFVPWVYLTFERKRISSQKFKKRSRKLEIKLIYSSLESDDLSGLIGRQSKENLQRHASGVYWQGLHRWGIRKFDGSEPEYRRSLDSFYARCRGYKDMNDEFEGETRADSMPCNWDTSLPPIPSDFPNDQKLRLNREQANYLSEQIITNCPDSMLAFLIGRGESVAKTNWAWDYKDQANERLRKILVDAQNFSEMIHGAQLLYNLMLSELTKSQDNIDGYRNELDDWWERISRRRSEIESWNVDEFWKFVQAENPRLSLRAKKFIDEWIGLFRGAKDISFLDNSHTRNLLERREVQLKRSLARLTNDRALEMWSGRAGANQLDLRWRSARTILTDILIGLGVSEAEVSGNA